jgi:hypothetical protein
VTIKAAESQKLEELVSPFFGDEEVRPDAFELWIRQCKKFQVWEFDVGHGSSKNGWRGVWTQDQKCRLRGKVKWGEGPEQVGWTTLKVSKTDKPCPQLAKELKAGELKVHKDFSDWEVWAREWVAVRPE